MLTLERGRGWSIYILGGAKRYMGFGPLLCADRRSRMSGRRAGCPGLQEGPDVRADGANFCSLWIGGVGCPGWGAGCPAAREEPDVRASGRMSELTWFSFGCLLRWALDFWAGAGCPGLREGPDVWGLAGCPGPVAFLRFLSSCSFILVLGDLSIIPSISERVSLVPRHM